jgi:hypothetical protein
MRRDSVRKLKELNDAERATLALGELCTRTELASLVARDGLTATVAQTRMDRGRLRDALVRYSLAEAKGRTRALPVRVLRAVAGNWRELVLLALAGFAAAGVWRALGHPESVLVAAHDMAPYQVIGAGDVKQRRTEAGFGTYARPGEVTGRFPLQPVTAGDAMRRDRLSRFRVTRPADLRDRRVVSLPVTRQSAPLAAPGSRVLLLLSPTQAGDGGARVLHDAIVLDARVAGDTSSVVVAITVGDFDVLGPLLGRSLITVARQRAIPSP